MTFFWRNQKTRSNFFVKNITFCLLSNLFWWLEKLAAVLSQNCFGIFCYCVPPWRISIHGYFGPLGSPLWHCNSLCLEHDFLFKSILSWNLAKQTLLYYTNFFKLKWALNLCDTEHPRLIPRIRLWTANRKPVSQWKIVRPGAESFVSFNNCSLGNRLVIRGS